MGGTGAGRAGPGIPGAPGLRAPSLSVCVAPPAILRGTDALCSQRTVHRDRACPAAAGRSSHRCASGERVDVTGRAAPAAQWM